MRRALSFAIVAAAFSASVASAQPTAKSARTVILPIEGSVPHALATELGSALTTAGHPAQLARMHVDELMLTSGCAERSDDCLARIGKALRANVLILVKVVKSKQVLLQRFSVDTQKQLGTADATLADNAVARRKQWQAIVRTLFAIQTPQAKSPARGQLEITSLTANVQIKINNVDRGDAPLTLKDLSPGRYQVEARRAGYTTWLGDVQVEAGKTAKLQIKLSLAAVRIKRTPSFWKAISIPTWIVAGSGAAAMLVGVGFGAHMLAEQNDFDRNEGLTLEQIRRLEQSKSTGERDALVANIMYGIGGGLIVAAGVMAYIDYLRTRPLEKAPTAPASKTGPSARVLVGPGSVGLDVKF